jgi:8-oxo-dGTP pyrophosphatase MutT (NUDIX family)
MTNYATLLACLAALPRPDDAEEWVEAAAPDFQTPVSTDYRRAILDLLTLLGAVQPDGTAFTAPMGYYLTRSLIALAHDAADSQPALAQAWQGRKSNLREGFGARLVNVLEAFRGEALPNPTPLRTIVAVAAIIKARRGADDVFLMQHDPAAEQYQPIGGKREIYDANDEAAMIRELCEELLLESVTPGRDVTLQLVGEVRGEQKVSSSLQLLTRYSHTFFHFTNVRFPLNTDEQTRWLTLAELEAGRTADGAAISGLLSALPSGTLAKLPYSVADEVR